MEPETVICRWCDDSHQLSSSKQCPGCGEILYTHRELMDQLAVKNERVNTLNGEIAGIRIELWNRKMRTQAVYFWEQPSPSLKTKKPVRRERVTSLDDVPDLI